MKTSGTHWTITIWLFNIANWKIPKINGGFVRWENHLFRLGPWLPHLDDPRNLNHSREDLRIGCLPHPARNSIQGPTALTTFARRSWRI